MKILERIAQDIVDKTSEILKYPISITDKRGYIIGASDKSRIGILHQPSLGIIEINKIEDNQCGVDQKVLPGATLPIEYNNQVIGVLGIVGGEPKEVAKYAQLVKNQVEMMLQEAFRQEMVELNEKMVEIFVHQIIHYDKNDVYEHFQQYSTLLNINLHANYTCLLIDISDFTGKVHRDEDNEGTTGDFPLQYFQKEVLGYLDLILIENDDDIISVLNIERFIIHHLRNITFLHSFIVYYQRKTLLRTFFYTQETDKLT